MTAITSKPPVVEPSRFIVALRRLAIVAACASSSACVHQAQFWPTPLTAGKQVTAKFVRPRAISVGADSVLVLNELSGKVVALHGDTLVVRLTKVADQPTHAAWAGREAIVPLDSATTVTYREFDESAVVLMTVAGFAFVYAFIGSLP